MGHDGHDQKGIVSSNQRDYLVNITNNKNIYEYTDTMDTVIAGSCLDRDTIVSDLSAQLLTIRRSAVSPSVYRPSSIRIARGK